MSLTDLDIMFMSGPDDGRVIHLSQRRGQGTVEPDGTWMVVFGRSDECDVPVPFDTQVSRRHAMLQVGADGEMWLSDAGSLNGTYVDKVRVTGATPLKRGMLFRIGRTWMRVQADSSEA